MCPEMLKSISPHKEGSYKKIFLSDKDADQIYDDFLREQEVSSQINRELSREELQQQAYDILEKDFQEYDDQDEDATTKFFVTAYDLDRLFFPYAPPETVTDIDERIAKSIGPLLTKLQSKYPEAVRAFVKSFDLRNDDHASHVAENMPEVKRAQEHLETAQDVCVFLDKIEAQEVPLNSITFQEAYKIFSFWENDARIDERRIWALFGLSDNHIIPTGAYSYTMMSALEVVTLENDFQCEKTVALWDELTMGGEMTVYGWSDVVAAVDHITRVMTDTKITQKNIDNFLYAIADSISDNPGNYDRFAHELLARLDLDHPEKFATNSALLDAVRYFEHYTRVEQREEWDEDKQNFYALTKNSLREHLLYLQKSSSGNYILHAKIDHILDEDAQFTKYGMLANAEAYPFQIAPRQFAMFYAQENTILTTREEDYERASELVHIVDLYRAYRKKQIRALEAAFELYEEALGDKEDFSLSYTVHQLPHSLFAEETELDNIDRINALDEFLYHLAQKYPTLTEKIQQQTKHLANEFFVAYQTFDTIRDGRSYNGLETELFMLLLDGGPMDERALSYDEGAHSTQQGNNLLEYRYLISEFMRTHIQEHFGITLSDMTLAEQNYFLSVLKNRTLENVQHLQTFTRSFGISGARTFLSLEHGGQEMGDKIFKIGEKYPLEVADKIFAKYGELVDITQSLLEIFEEDNVSARQINHMRDAILLRGKKILESFADLVVDDENVDKVLEKVMQMLERVRGDAEATKALVRSAREEGKSFQELQSVRQQTLSAEQIKEKSAIIREHYAKTIKKESPEMQEALLEKYDMDIAAGATVEVVTNKDKIIASLLVTAEKGGKELRISAFSGDEVYGELRLGNQLLDNVIKKYASPQIRLYGDASLMKARVYIGKFDAVGVKIVYYGGESSMEINFAERSKYRSADMTRREALAALESGDENDGDIRVVAYDENIFPEKEMNDGYVITNIYQMKERGKNLFVCEKALEK